jgi:HK97 family phage major capsid protein
MSQITRADLLDLIKSVSGTAIMEALEPFQKQHTGWMEQILNQQLKAAEPPLEKGIALARFVRAIVGGRYHGERPAVWAARQWGEANDVVKALAAGDATAGGFIVPPNYMTEISELLRPASVVRSLNPVLWPMPNGTANAPKLMAGSAASYISENQNIGVTQPAFGSLALAAKKLAAIVPISNDLIRYSSPAADTVVRDDLVAALAQRQDLAFIRGDGLQNTPKGLRYWAPAANVIAANATVTLQNTTNDLGKLVLALKNANVRMLRPGWLMSPRTEMYLMTVRDGNSNYVYRAEMLGGRLWGYPYRPTTQIPDNLGAGNDSELYFADFMDAVIGEAMGLMIDASQEAAYYDGTQVQAAFSRDQTVIRAIEEHDFGMRHDASVAVLTGVTWAPS